jgi:hypothetical protein
MFRKENKMHLLYFSKIVFILLKLRKKPHVDDPKTPQKNGPSNSCHGVKRNPNQYYKNNKQTKFNYLIKEAHVFTNLLSVFWTN